MTKSANRASGEEHPMIQGLRRTQAIMSNGNVQTIAWLRDLAAKGGKGIVNNIDARCLGRIADEIERLSELNNKLTEDFNTLALDRAQWQERAENAELNFTDQKVISNYSREQAIKALAALKLARPYVARIASRTSGPDVRDHLSKIDALIGKQD